MVFSHQLGLLPLGDRLGFVCRNELGDSKSAGSAASFNRVRYPQTIQEDHRSFRRSRPGRVGVVSTQAPGECRVGDVVRLGPVKRRVFNFYQLEWHAHLSAEVA